MPPRAPCTLLAVVFLYPRSMQLNTPRCHSATFRPPTHRVPVRPKRLPATVDPNNFVVTLSEQDMLFWKFQREIEN
ncbi:hypothetical protein OG21DRAFT_1515655 [Imleria badia]|nr:hypothetical protein OG21DRAFT_1515655 [Imleria badia]